MSSFSSIVIGDESLLVQCSERMLARGHSIRAVVTRSVAVEKWAADRGLTVIPPGPGLADRLRPYAADWILSIANLAILPETVRMLGRRGAINFHDGPLPRHAGLNAPVWALIEGETVHGITWHLIEGNVDEGDILVTRAFDIGPEDTALTLNAKAYEAAIESFPELLGQLEAGVLDRRKQDLSDRSYHARDDRPGAHGLLNFSRPAAEVERLVRALDHGGYWNPLAMAKVRAKDELWLVGAAEIVEAAAAAPGTVLSVDETRLTVACSEGALRLLRLHRISGKEVQPRDLARDGDVLPVPDPEEVAAITARKGQIAMHCGWWRTRLAGFVPLQIPGVGAGQGEIQSLEINLPGGPAGVARIAAWAGQIAGVAHFDLACTDHHLSVLAEGGFIMPWTPLHCEAKGTLSEIAEVVEAELAARARHVGFATDLFARAPELDWPDVPAIGVAFHADHIRGTAITVDVERGRLTYDSGMISPEHAALLAARLELLAGMAEESCLEVAGTLPAVEREVVLGKWNQTSKAVDLSLTMHRAFEGQVARTPWATALIFEDAQLSYAELNARANRAAHVLVGMGVVPGEVVGLCCRRSIDLMVGALAILKAGAAYLPMDPSYPADRLRHFVEDSMARVIVTQAMLEPELPPHDAQILALDAEPRLADAPADNLGETAGPEDLAYLIYTSGSTGKPKGVMVEHRNAINFYAGMDDVVAHDPPGTWLAVTSLSFDISVLELFYTTARGFTVVLTSDENRALISNGPLRVDSTGMDFSIYYWGNDDGSGRDKYRLLLEGAKFADENGFVAVWTPERHFHAFGGPYPNPSVTGAAVAAVTRNIGVRAGSVVSPLHHPARIAEEWGVIDNLTNGRAGLAIASGWQPDDFILRPENTPPDNKTAMSESIDQIRALWRGEAVSFPRRDGEMHAVVTQPRPVSTELPVWVTTAGNPETWKEAGRKGCNVLTHLLGQSVAEVGEKITLYHAALREAGHDPEDFTVTLMLHTFVSDSRDHSRESAREPMKDYLRSAAGLIKQYAWVFPAFKRPAGVANAFDLKLDDLEAEELDAILDFAFERYFNESGLFGTVEDALARVEEVKAIGVGEIACLIDYGIERQQVLEGLEPLARVVRAMKGEETLAEDDFSIAGQIVRHGVTHMQCTPSMARMIAMNDEARVALSRVKHLYLGGEPLPGALVSEFAEITDASVTNMYGPTETTIWSSTREAVPADGVVGLGVPIANTQFYVLDEGREPVGLGEEGELWIGGAGVTRGYFNRAELTAERFVQNPFHEGRMYRTGDLVRRNLDGTLSFLGRVDHQIKLRGFRIELGEIEGVIEAQPGVTQAVVSAREEQAGDVRLVGYYTGTRQSLATLKSALAERLPSFMVPGQFVWLESFPLTPNKKIDRNALPALTTGHEQHEVARQPSASATPPAPGDAVDIAQVRADVAAIWSRILGVSNISAQANFFDLGGHSLLAVQAHRALRDELGAKSLSITDIFRFPALDDLSQRIAALVVPGSKPVQDFAASRQTRVLQPVSRGEVARAYASAESEPENPRARARAEAMAKRRAMRARREK